MRVDCARLWGPSGRRGERCVERRRRRGRFRWRRNGQGVPRTLLWSRRRSTRNSRARVNMQKTRLRRVLARAARARRSRRQRLLAIVISVIRVERGTALASGCGMRGHSIRRTRRCRAVLLSERARRVDTDGGARDSRGRRIRPAAMAQADAMLAGVRVGLGVGRCVAPATDGGRDGRVGMAPCRLGNGEA